MIIDKYKRRLNYLRISITDRCNLRCIYCSPRDYVSILSHKEILRYEEILHLIKVGVRIGITKVRITGGEPLIRKDVYKFLSKLTKIDGLVDVSITTNGVLLKDNIENIKSTGIKRLNISIDTLDRQKFNYITGRDNFDRVWSGIEAAQQTGFYPIKLNVVALKGINDDELAKIAELSFLYPFYIRFIEYMPIGISHIDAGKYLSAPEILKHLSILGQLFPVEKEINEGPAESYKFKGSVGKIGIIRPVSHHFCKKCNRLRLTASGSLRPCLLSNYQEDIKFALRKGKSDDDIADIFFNVAQNKPFQHHLNDGKFVGVTAQMSAIGG